MDIGANRDAIDKRHCHHLLPQHGADLRGGLADGGMPVNLRMLRRIDQGEEVEARTGLSAGIVAGA